MFVAYARDQCAFPQDMVDMDEAAIMQWMRLALEWVGFGTLVGLIAKAIMPGKDTGGALATVIIGILGSVIGAALLAFFIEGQRISPISPLGFVVALGGTTLLLAVTRLMSGGGWGRMLA
jgi:uncharacterized membrane protein YeaQ/YmgE (transglycosylase-associated protein family)